MLVRSGCVERAVHLRRPVDIGEHFAQPGDTAVAQVMLAVGEKDRRNLVSRTPLNPDAVRRIEDRAVA